MQLYRHKVSPHFGLNEGMPNGLPALHLSHEKRAPGWLGYIGVPSYIGIIIGHEIRIPIKQPVFHGK